MIKYIWHVLPNLHVRICVVWYYARHSVAPIGLYQEVVGLTFSWTVCAAEACPSLQTVLGRYTYSGRVRFTHQTLVWSLTVIHKFPCVCLILVFKKLGDCNKTRLVYGFWIVAPLAKLYWNPWTLVIVKRQWLWIRITLPEFLPYGSYINLVRLIHDM